MRNILFFTVLLIMLICYGSFIEAADVRKVDLNLEKNEISFSFLALPNGEATLIQTGIGKNILVNTGGPYSAPQLIDRLEMYNVEKIDKLIITNDDKEYCANLIWLKKSIAINGVIISNQLKEDFIKKYKFENHTVHAWKQGDLFELSPNLFVKVLYSGSNENENNGMVLSFYFGSQKFLYMGNADPNVEMDVVKKLQSKAQILKVGEFASRGTSQDFLEKVNPEVAVIFHKKNKFPSQEIKERLNETWIDIYQTRQFGNVTIKCDQDNYEVITIQGDA